MKKRILSGIQPSGKLHIGNYFGMIKPMVEHQETADLFCFIANLHSLTTVRDKKKMEEMTQEAVLDLLALGIDPEKCTFWKQSDVPEVAELAWILSCLTPFSLMEKAHSYKDKLAKGIHPTLGLFSYPALMAADILLYQTEVVPVGKDQKQHVEITRDLAIKFNNAYGDILTLPEPRIKEEVAVIPGTDGQKMSKSYGNIIPLFDEPSVIKKAVMGIVTDSKSVEEPKDPEACNVFQLYKLFASESEQKELSARYRQGGMGYGEAKKMLLEKITQTFSPFQEKRHYYQSHPEEIDGILARGAEKAHKIALETIERVRRAVGI